MLFNQAAGFLFLTTGKVTIKVIPIGVKWSTIKIGKFPSIYHPSLKTISACNLLQASWFIIILTSNSGRNTPELAAVVCYPILWLFLRT